MTRRSFAAALAAQVPAARRPNIVLFLADDLGWGDVGFHGGITPTPNIDRIAREGLELARCYSYPFCSPTRAALLTGRMPVRFGMVYNVIRAWSPNGIPLDEHLFPETLKAAGYQTACIGKWHLGHAHRKLLPNARGFDHFYGCVNAEIHYFTHKFMGGLDWQRNGKSVDEDGYATTLLADEALRWLAARDASRPFFLYFPFNAVHTPLSAPDEVLFKFRDRKQDKLRILGGAIDVLDTSVGRVLDYLDKQNLASDTIVLFLSDNGGPLSQGASNGSFRGAKGTTFEGGIHVPAVIRWPGKLTKGARTQQVMSVADIFPTLAAAAGVEPTGKKPLDGKNLWPQLTTGAIAEREPLVFAVKSNERADYRFAVLHREWKLVRIVEEGNPNPADHLFDLATDPSEKADIAGKHPAKVKELFEVLDNWRALHPDGDIVSSVRPHPGWIAPSDYAAAARVD
jgi:arylsulfatase A-like enzyme